ncbi:MAG: HemY protein, partial [Planctomycetota bacterium]
AAQLQGKHDERDAYLKAAHEAQPEAEIAIGVTQAELQLSHRQTEQALATLSHLHSIAPRHDYVSMLLARAYCEIEDWKSLVELLPDVGRKKLLKPSRLKMMEQAGYSGYLSDVAKQGDRDAMEKAWNSIPKTLQTDAVLVVRYVDLLIAQGWQSNTVESLMAKTLEKNWSDELVDCYGRYQSKNANGQLAIAEKWLEDMGQDECLLLALGRIAMRAKLWGKAQGYFEASIGARATAAACLALAELFDHQLGQKGKAAELYSRGLKLSVNKIAAE